MVRTRLSVRYTKLMYDPPSWSKTPVQRAYGSIDYNIHRGIHNETEFVKQTIRSDNSLTEDEKTEAVRVINKTYDRNKILFNEGTRRICEKCNQKCLATLYCECCVRNYLKANFSNWTSGNSNIDELIQKCQIESLGPEDIVEWIPYNNLKNVKYLTEGGFSKIYTASWINGKYEEWDSKKQKLIRCGTVKAILKELEKAENANKNWFEEAKIHLNVSSKYPRVVQCSGLTQNPSNGNFMLVMNRMDVNLREYLQQNYNQLSWKERIKITISIIDALYCIHKEKLIHRDLHSGNILYLQKEDFWLISDLGFCGPVNKSPKSIYGNLPYIAPEVVAGKKNTFASDIYSIAMLMWEISSGQPPFNKYEHDYYLATNIVNGIGPKIVSGTPLGYKNLMKQCWDADPLERPDIKTLRNKISEINASYQNIPIELDVDSILETSDSETNYTSSRLFTSKIHQFENFPEPRNATEEEQEAFHSGSYKFSIPDNINDFNNSSNQSHSNTSKSSNIPKVFNNLKINSKNDMEAIQRLNTKKQDIDVNDMQIEEIVLERSIYQTEQNNSMTTDNKNEEKGKSKRIYSDDKEDLTDNNKFKKLRLNSNKNEDEIFNNPNLHSEDQDELEIPEKIN
ncbi:hypothetical protein RclHR1_11440005 [Rhizophagus clarus]|uniref:Protein kinase domain-containing protein n=1 Tax=Rhizophagus clarus TaxID=94130 RepID=A0A2Z6QX93_9GLOM|nr:hypothetical protein RclHR1_11440005 [Rhizophagus clarus]